MPGLPQKIFCHGVRWRLPPRRCISEIRASDPTQRGAHTVAAAARRPCSGEHASTSSREGSPSVATCGTPPLRRLLRWQLRPQSSSTSCHRS